MSIVPNSSVAHLHFVPLLEKHSPSASADQINPAAAIPAIEPVEKSHSTAEPSSALDALSNSQSTLSTSQSTLSTSQSTLPATANSQSTPRLIPGRKLHRVAEVRAAQGIGERAMCKRLNIDAKTLHAWEDESSDLTVSQLLKISSVLEVPVSELLIDLESSAQSIRDRAKLVKVMKTTVSLRESKLPIRAARLAEMLHQQIVDIMPELSEVSGWPEFGSRRGSDSIARILSDQVDTSAIGLP